MKPESPPLRKSSKSLRFMYKALQLHATGFAIMYACFEMWFFALNHVVIGILVTMIIAIKRHVDELVDHINLQKAHIAQGPPTELEEGDDNPWEEIFSLDGDQDDVDWLTENTEY